MESNIDLQVNALFDWFCYFFQSVIYVFVNWSPCQRGKQNNVSSWRHQLQSHDAGVLLQRLNSEKRLPGQRRTRTQLCILDDNGSLNNKTYVKRLFL